MSGFGQYSSHEKPVTPGHPLYVDSNPKGGRAKHVFGSGDTDVSHVWAHPLADGSGYYQTHGRNPQSNYFFKTDRDGTRVLYSYRESYPIASTFEVGRKRVYLVRSGKPYSVTTATHVHGAHHAIPASALVFDVPYVTRYRFESRSSLPFHGNSSWISEAADSGKPDAKTHNANLRDIISQLQQALANYGGARAAYRIKSYFEEAQSLSKTAKSYAKVFGLRLPKLPAAPKWDKPRYDAAKTAADLRDARTRARREAEALEYEKKQAENISLWKAGAAVYIGHTAHAFLRVILVDGLYHVETSQRVTVPVSGQAGAARLFRFLKAVQESGRTYQRNGHTQHIGTFAVDSFRPAEDPAEPYILEAGCHRITWTEVLTVADSVLAAEAQETNPSQA